MKIFTFYELNGDDLIYLKTVYDISKHRCISKYISGENRRVIDAEINSIFIIAPKHYEEKYIYKTFVNKPLSESYTNSRRNVFSANTHIIRPNMEISTELNFAYCNGFIFPEKYRNHNIIQYDYFDDIKPQKKRHYFKQGIDEIYIENFLVSPENRTPITLNN